MRPILHALTIALSAALLFLVEPMAAKAFLPWFGGAAGVWLACVLFFQLTLLAGYAYAFALTRYIGARGQRALHIGLVLAAILTLQWTTPAPHLADNPTWSILLSLAGSIGLPFLILSATSPLVQAWYVASGEARFPYGLFALSNAASLLALLAYPSVIEPASLLSAQFHAWAWGFGAFAALLAACAASSLRGPAQASPESSALPAWHSAVWWISLAACAAALWPAVANHLSQQVAPIPFLWVLPLALYLLTFILCFYSDGLYNPRLFRILLPIACAAFAWRLAFQGSAGGIEWEIPILLAALFVCCMFCHGELAALKPDPEHGLAYFYLMVALGGAAGAAFVAVVAPNVFDTYLELPVAIAACVVLSLRLLYRRGSGRQILRLCAVAAFAFAAASRYTSRDSVYRERNFYGALQVVDAGSGDDAVRKLYHGKILHGLQYLAREKSRIPTGYYGPESGAAIALWSVEKRNRRVGIVGLGTGTLAVYGRPGDTFRFYDINAAVVDVARTYFRFLNESGANIETVVADGRKAIEAEPAHSFDAILLDAFAGDTIPVHLLTREAFRAYFGRLAPGGVLAIHVTNRYLNIASVVQAAAADAHQPFRLVHSPADVEAKLVDNYWAVIDTREQFQKSTGALVPWTDEYISVFSILR